jgi:DNA-binding IclR family transcriptional regulator
MERAARKPRQDGAKDRQFVTALARGLDVLRAFEAGEALANSEIAARTGLPRPTISRLTHTLTKLGYLIRDPLAESYRPSSAVLSLGYGAVAGTEFRAIARPHMQRIADFARSTCALGQCHGLEMIYVENCRGANAPFTLGLDVGSRIPLADTAMGRAYLAASAPKTQSEMLRALARHHGVRWKEIQPGLERALSDCARDGFSLSVAEWAREINAAAVAIHFPEGMMALNCGGAASLLPPERLKKEIGPHLLEAKRQIEMHSTPQREARRA